MERRRVPSVARLRALASRLANGRESELASERRSSSPRSDPARETEVLAKRHVTGGPTVSVPKAPEHLCPQRDRVRPPPTPSSSQRSRGCSGSPAAPGTLLAPPTRGISAPCRPPSPRG